jgi:hypothetical protein
MMEELIPSQFYLSQNFPNPFNEQTNIKYCLPVKAKVNLNIYNSDGDLVKELLNNTQEAGTYEIKLNGCDFLEGQYFYVIEAVDLGSGLKKIFNDTKKMLMIK